MKREERLCMLTHATEVFMDAGKGARMMLDVARRCCEFLVLEHGGDILGIQLGSREWDCPQYGSLPLTLKAIRALERLGFARGGYHANPWVRATANDPDELALFCERVLIAGYTLPTSYELSVFFQDAAHAVQLLDALECPAPRRGAGRQSPDA